MFLKRALFMLHTLSSTPPSSLPGICAAQCRAEQSKYLSKRSLWGIPTLILPEFMSSGWHHMYKTGMPSGCESFLDSLGYIQRCLGSIKRPLSDDRMGYSLIQEPETISLKKEE